MASVIGILFPDERLGGGYSYDDNTHAIYGKKLEQIDIPHEVVSYNHNRRYIVAKQYLHIGMLDTTWFNLRGRHFDGTEKYYYWIIDKKRDTIYGPIDSMKFYRLKTIIKDLPELNENIQ